MRKKRIEDIQAEDLIGRNFDPPAFASLKLQLHKKTVLVTGAGGSIGSELSRQLVQMGISCIILAEHSELALYHIYEELVEKGVTDKITVVPYLINICNINSLEFLFDQHTPDFIYHAAAYKHVNIVEVNPFSGIRNNLVSTRNLLEVSAKYNVSRFVLVSTDKAVNPSTIMGSTKRVCELMTTHLAEKANLNFSSVRFGNVAGSSGSVIPKFKRQISQHKPITITDKRMERYFMLIPEAVSLVLKSSESASPGDIKLLNMGKPIKISDIVEKMLTLSGRDIETYPIIYTGIKPGEKLSEELMINDKHLFLANETFINLKDGDEAFEEVFFNGRRLYDIFQVVDEVVRLAHLCDHQAIELLRNTVMHKSAQKKAA